MDISKADLGVAFDLLRKHSTLERVSHYLRVRDLPYAAGSWPAMYETRLLPLLQAGRIDRSDIVTLVREAEEYGRQHVFLFRCSKRMRQNL